LKARNEAFKELLRREKQYVANLQLIVKVRTNRIIGPMILELFDRTGL
jgi:hypothetical protein